MKIFMDNITDIYNKNKKNILGNNLIWLEDFRNEIINGIKKEGLPNKKMKNGNIAI